MRTACTLALLAVTALSACESNVDNGMAKRLADANAKLVESKQQVSRLESDIAALKRQVAEALADPSKIVLHDPDIIELVADLRAERNAGAAGAVGDELTIGKGDLNPKEASQVVMRGAQALQQCYERALKKNQSLQYQAGVKLTLGVTVKATGSVETVSVTPSIDAGLTSCIDGAAKRWKFPKFAGSTVTVEQHITLTPKT